MLKKSNISYRLSLLLLLLLLGNMVGFVFWNSVRTVCYHYVREHRQVIGVRDTIIMSLNDFNNIKIVAWHKHDEIAYYGNMFDIKKQIKQQDKIILIGHFDKFENKLFKVLYKLLDNGNNGKEQSAHPNFWVIDAIIQPINTYIVYRLPALARSYPLFVLPYYSIGYSSFTPKPPELAV